jgi:hypothetical protein
MGHTIRASRGCTHVVVDMDGMVLSSHRSEEAAQREIAREMRAFKRSPYGRNGAYLPRSIIVMNEGGTAYVERDGQYSTGWSSPSEKIECPSCRELWDDDTWMDDGRCPLCRP